MKLINYFMTSGVSQRQLAMAIGVTPQAICLYTKGNRTPSLKVAQRIVKLTKGKVQWEDLIPPEKDLDLPSTEGIMI